MRYSPSKIEPKWQDLWEESKLFEAPRDINELKKKPKYYALDMFPYPSAAGLHVGHPEGYTATDVVARYKRMNGYNVLHSIGWDAFGLPAERAAMREGIHPEIITKRNIDNFRSQMKKLGFFYDWSREISTTDENYYKWTQWIFLKLYDKGLAYLADAYVNWCPNLKTVLANEEVKDGKYIETQDPVEKKLMRQWMLKITAYAQRLLDDLEELDWPESIKEMQRNWIGRSEGANVKFKTENSCVEVYTTRPDTLFGVTFIALSLEHELARDLLTEDNKALGIEFINKNLLVSEATRTDAAKEKNGFFTGSYAYHPITNKKIPIYLADYVLTGYGTGCVMGVPSDDERDKDFAVKYGIEIIEIFDEAGLLKNSDFVNGLSSKDASKKIIDYLTKNNLGECKVQYKLRDWLFSRQRYWGEPFPIIYLPNGDTAGIDVKELPVSLPKIDEYKPTDSGEPPLARAKKEWREVKLSDGTIGIREVNTMPQWAGSCWYYLRYLDPQNDNEAYAQEFEKYWMPVDLYIGGVEHAVLHLLYARFWHKVLYDCGLVHTKEPFQKLFNQGMILAQSYRDDSGKYYHPSEVYEKNGVFFSIQGDKKLATQIEKMSKSKFNVVNPEEVIDQYGADAMRLYEMFMGPLEQVKPWKMAGVEGVYRFLSRVWRLVVDEETGNFSSKLKFDQQPESEDILKSLHKTIKKVGEDIENLRFNTAISQMMTFVNDVTVKDSVQKETILTFLHLLSPFAPHLCDEIFTKLGEKGFLLSSSWPTYDEKLVLDDSIDLVVQVNGKRRSNIIIPVTLSDDEVKTIALADNEVKKFIDDKEIVKVILVKNRLVNIVVK